VPVASDEGDAEGDLPGGTVFALALGGSVLGALLIADDDDPQQAAMLGAPAATRVSINAAVAPRFALAGDLGTGRDRVAGHRRRTVNRDHDERLICSWSRKRPGSTVRGLGSQPQTVTSGCDELVIARSSRRRTTRSC